MGWDGVGIGTGVMGMGWGWGETCGDGVGMGGTSCPRAAFYPQGRPHGVPYKEKYVSYARGQIYCAKQHANLHDGKALSHT